MNALRKRKLYMILVLLCILSIAAALVLYALRQNISLFYTPTDLVDGKAPTHHAMRLGGMVVDHSIVRGDSLSLRFKVTDYKHTVDVLYSGVLPDLFREGKGVVVQGQWGKDQRFHAVEVLAKHDENYMPRELKQRLGKHPT